MIIYDLPKKGDKDVRVIQKASTGTYDDSFDGFSRSFDAKEKLVCQDSSFEGKFVITVLR